MMNQMNLLQAMNIKEGTKLKHRTNKKLECEKYEKIR